MTIPDARTALVAGDFDAALGALADCESEATADWLQLRAQASYGAGAYEDAVGAWEQLHTLHRTNGENGPAARAAMTVAMLLLIDAGMLSPSEGGCVGRSGCWTARTTRLNTP